VCSGRELKSIPTQSRNQNNSVGIATWYKLDNRGSILDRVKRFLSSPQRPDRLWRPPSLLSSGYQGLFPRGKAPGQWSWPLTSIQFWGQELWSCTSTPPRIFILWYLIKSAQWKLLPYLNNPRERVGCHPVMLENHFKIYIFE
jgi:hypothetical protein